VQNCRINPDFDLFLLRKNGGPSPWAADRTRVAGPRVHRGAHSGRRPELTGALTACCYGLGIDTVDGETWRGQRREAHARLQWVVR
jgi:hypothetical protein